MLHSVITVSKGRDGTPDDADGIRPLDARSLALSALLGTHPPRLPARSLVALAELFGIADGTMRTALSRMVRNGELATGSGGYELGGSLLQRQRAQDTGRRPADPNWDGRWHTVVTTADRRSVAERRAFRQVMADHRFAELRPETWMRPANLSAPTPDDSWILVTGAITSASPEALVERLWDLDAIASRAERLIDRLDSVSPGRDGPDRPADPASIPARFETAAAVLRFLRSEPLLPPPLVGGEWPVDGLRDRYARAESDLQADLRSFFRANASPAEQH